MKRKKTINDLVKQLEDDIHQIEQIDTSLEDTLDIYKQTIETSKELLTLLNKNKKTFHVLKNKADSLMEKINE